MRKARIVVAFRNERGAAFAGIEEDNLATVTREVDRGRQASGTAAHDQTVELFH